MKRRRLVFLAVALGVAACASAIGVLVYLRMTAPRIIHVALETDAEARTALEAAIAEWDAKSPRFEVLVLEAGDTSGADLALGPMADGAVAWRCIGPRLWTRLETLAGLEAKLGRQLILPLREGRTGARELGALIADAARLGVAGLALPRSPDRFRKLASRYGALLAGESPEQLDDSIIVRNSLATPDVESALRALSGGKALFILADDQVGRLVQTTPDCHPEAFALPVPDPSRPAWALGRAEGFTLAAARDKDRRSEEAAAASAELLAWLTSKGMARRFGNGLQGRFYYWNEAPLPGTPPVPATKSPVST